MESGDLDCALAGGNVCAVARRRGITAFVADGLIRDLAEVREVRSGCAAAGSRPTRATRSD
ncbi:hypothetical protein GCM10010103_40440 [Streptomyces paradoxus]|uniref:Regulator of RNase E activity RraA n=1 Tax=Streptomyces paradoxus TaxID=66375 RepID=A0A7W9TBN8_9ACTN|nr:regulator of RNase E activity RraA [Streptomyces paradoxus]